MPFAAKLKALATWLATHPPTFFADPKWWIDHLVDILTLIATIVLTFFIHSLDSNERQQDAATQNAATKQLTDGQDLTRRQAGSETDVHQAYTLLSDLQLQRTAGHEVERRSIAEVIQQYFADGRLYEPASRIFLPVIQTECDQITFDHLRTAVQNSANVNRRDAITDDDKGKDVVVRSQTQAKLQVAVAAHDGVCKAQQVRNGTPAAPAAIKQIEVPLGYFDVGCDQPRSESRVVPLSTVVPPGYQASDPRADFRDTSNVKQASAAASIQSGNVLVTSSLVGIDAQTVAFGIRNCPGGGHGTLVLHLTLRPVPPATTP